jgi:hypothetical protein
MATLHAKVARPHSYNYSLDDQFPRPTPAGLNHKLTIVLFLYCCRLFLKISLAVFLKLPTNITFSVPIPTAGSGDMC